MKEYDPVHQVTYIGTFCTDNSGVIVRIVDMFDGGTVAKKIGSSWDSALKSAKEYVNSLHMMGGFILN